MTVFAGRTPGNTDVAGPENGRSGPLGNGQRATRSHGRGQGNTDVADGRGTDAPAFRLWHHKAVDKRGDNRVLCLICAFLAAAILAIFHLRQAVELSPADEGARRNLDEALRR